MRFGRTGHARGGKRQDRAGRGRSAERSATHRARRRRSRGSTRTSPTSRRATTRWSGERGITLSGGQKQRTAIARAVVDRSAHPDPRRCAVGGGYVHRRGDPVAAARRDAAADLDHRVAPHLHRPRRRPDLRARSTAASSSAARTTSWSAQRRPLRRAAQEAAARGGAGGVMKLQFTLPGSRFSVRVQVRCGVLSSGFDACEPGARAKKLERRTSNREPRTEKFELRTELEHELRSENREA